MTDQPNYLKAIIAEKLGRLILTQCELEATLMSHERTIADLQKLVAAPDKPPTKQK